MKKLFVYGFSVLMLGGLASCKSTESAYKKAYEQAKQQEASSAQEEEVIYAEVPEFKPVVEPAVKVQAAKPTKPEAGVRQEKVTVVSGNGLNKYSVVAGSFGVKSNANNLKSFLDNAGYSSTVVYNAELNMYRVVVSSFNDRASAERARDSFKSKYSNRKDFQGSWLLYSL